MDRERRYASAGQFAKKLRSAHESLPDGNKTLLATEFVDFDALWDKRPELMDEIGRRVESLVGIAVDEAEGRMSVDSGPERMLAGFLSASGALRTALAIQSRLADDCWIHDHDVHLRIALHTGEPDHHNGQFRGECVHRVQRLTRYAASGQVLVSAVTAALLNDRLPPGTRLVEVELAPAAESTTRAGPVYSVETDDGPPSSPSVALPRPVVPPKPTAPPPRRVKSDQLVALLREHDELDELINVKLQQEAEAQRAGQPGLAERFGAAAAELLKRRIEVRREIERLEADGENGAPG
jgi:class 3 adenylate cyclase